MFSDVRRSTVCDIAHIKTNRLEKRKEEKLPIRTRLQITQVEKEQRQER